MLDPSLLENLDGSWPDDLRAYADKLRKISVSSEDETARLGLLAYAEFKAMAMDHRSAGRITQAKRLEDHCDSIYARLPKWAKW